MASNSKYYLIAAWSLLDFVIQKGVPCRIGVGIIDTLKRLLAVSLSPLQEPMDIPDRLKYKQIATLMDIHFQAIKRTFLLLFQNYCSLCSIRLFRAGWCEVEWGVLTDNA
ncbi:MAG: hypothetical protein KAU21_13885 [Gammaproteobacteria bacterium]|nr:hypothetical protein [Gammaproteobacteria bacterium]